MKDQLLTGIFTYVLPSALLWQVKTAEKAVFLTFDDGPIPELTDEILGILKQFDAKATFFCVGENVKRYPEIFARILQAGHAVGNHTHHHLKGWTTNYNDYIADISEAAGYINSGLFRPPYGLMTYRQAKILAKDYQVVMWSVLTKDYDPSVSKEECLETAIQGMRPGAIIVFHDNVKAKEKVLYALPRLLERMKEEGFVSEALTAPSLPNTAASCSEPYISG
ncbi:MAG: polysaccharide deacetylase family protein [Bacteroidales bacterium]|nr:polysaccharide deacetylase family protein [Bacteroidales bacterium]